MKSVKPGRGPSMMNAVSSIFGIVFGIIWTIAAAAMGAPFFFPLFGLAFIGIGVASTVYHFKNATGDARYSAFDIVDGDEEPDPLNECFGDSGASQAPEAPAGAFAYCPYCGAKLGEGFTFCGKCGKPLPKG